MYCRQCGSRINEGAAFCGTCGASVALAPGEAPAVSASLGAAAPFAASGGPFTGGRTDWTLRDVLFALLWFLGLLIILPIPFAIPFLIASGDAESPAVLTASLVGSAFADIGWVVTAVWFSFRKYGGGWERLGFRRPTWSTAGWAIAAAVAAFAFAAAYTGLIEWFDITALKSERDDQIPNEILDNAGLMALTGVLVIGFAPICEEILFRGFVFPGLAKAWGPVLAGAATAAIFASAHIGLAWHKTFIPIFLVAAVFAAAYYKSGNIFATIAAHLIFNTIAFIGLTQSDSDDAASVAWARDLLAGAMGR